MNTRLSCTVQARFPSAHHTRQHLPDPASSGVVCCVNTYWPLHGRTRVITIGTELDISDHNEFRHTYAGVDGAFQTWVVDFSDTRWIDSSVLGMLLLLRKSVGDDRRRVHLLGLGYKLRSALEAVNINALFTTDTVDMAGSVEEYPAVRSVQCLACAA